MDIKYKDSKTENLCKKDTAAKKFFEDMKYYKHLQALLNYIKQAPTAADILAFKNFHPTDFYIKDSFGLDIGGRRSKYRLIVALIDDEGKRVAKDAEFCKKCKQIKILEIEEVSKHYE